MPTKYQRTTKKVLTQEGHKPRNDGGRRVGTYDKKTRAPEVIPLEQWSINQLQVAALQHGDAGAPYRRELLRRDGIVLPPIDDDQAEEREAA